MYTISFSCKNDWTAWDRDDKSLLKWVSLGLMTFRDLLGIIKDGWKPGKFIAEPAYFGFSYSCHRYSTTCFCSMVNGLPSSRNHLRKALPARTDPVTHVLLPVPEGSKWRPLHQGMAAPQLSCPGASCCVWRAARHRVQRCAFVKINGLGGKALLLCCCYFNVKVRPWNALFYFSSSKRSLSPEVPGTQINWNNSKRLF